jgi:uncharacterized protein
MSQSRSSLDQALSDAELERLGAFLSSIANPAALTLEMMDGLLCALVIGPELVRPSEYVPLLFGGELPDENAFASGEAANDILSLVLRHSNSIVASFEREGLYLPMVFEPEAGRRWAELWSQGFMRGVNLRRSSWAVLISDDSETGSILPMALLAGEVDPGWLKRPASAEKQEELLQSVAAGLIRIYRYFTGARRISALAERQAATVRRESPKVGRNDPCPCGSGRKYKHCCGNVLGHAVH